MELKITQVDAFTDKPFAGNPAAVCVTQQPLEDDLMQAIAAEMNLSETAFLYPLQGSSADGYSLRWFTPATEVDLCGHATLASAHTLWHEGHLPAEKPAKFKTKSGWLTAKKIAKKSAKKQDSWIAMDFPAQPVEITQYVMPQLIKSLCCGGDIRVVAKNDHNYLVEVHSEKVLQTLQPDFVEMSKLPVQGVIVTAKADSEAYDFVSRYFAPAVGIDEDPVTGSAHTSLAPYWQDNLGKSEMTARQISARGGTVRVTCEVNGRITISGQAITVLQGTLSLS